MMRKPVAGINPALAPTKVLRDIPPDDAILWRYMRFPRFVALLASNQLWFARADQFPDHYEGAYGGLNAQRRIENYGEVQGRQFIERKRREIEYRRRRTYLNCWHENPGESAAMWEIYGRDNEAIAIVATFGALRSVFPPEVAVLRVKYVDFRTTFVSEGSSTDPFVYKRLSFDHEREVRAILQEQPEIRSEEDLATEHPPKGVLVGNNVLSAVERIHVAPRASDSFLGLVTEVCERYGCAATPLRSSLDDGPLF